MKHHLRASDFGYGNDNSVYINESLTPANRALLRLTREAAMQKNYTQVWTNNCKIFVRKEKGKAPVIKISSAEDIHAFYKDSYHLVTVGEIVVGTPLSCGSRPNEVRATVLKGRTLTGT
ncbi:hypothetical protein J6590_030932 [Homalodisca vitripennis]|nr:hypothetical protein J6590_030932 [Homalodisca vitripennis]